MDADMERKVRGRGRPNSKIPSIFDHIVCNSSTIESYYHKDGTPREGMYWSAYRKCNHKQLRRYLGVTSKLSITLLEDAARHLTDVCTTQPPKVKTPRKRPEKREILYARIKVREATIEQRDQTIAELEQKITNQEREIKELKASIRKLEAAAKTKRERLEL